MNSQILFYLNKISAISLLGIYYITFGIILSLLIRKVFDSENNKNKFIEKWDNSSTIRLILHIYLQTIVIMLGAYLIRKIVKNIPYPFDKHFGFEHSRLKELNGGVLIAFAIVVFLTPFKSLITYLIKNRLHLI